MNVKGKMGSFHFQDIMAIKMGSSIVVYVTNGLKLMYSNANVVRTD